MKPDLYERVATSEELDREHSESERAQADALLTGNFNEHGGELSEEDFAEALTS